MIIKYLQRLFNRNKTIKKLRLPYLEIDITEHCNLKCKACSHFSNIAEEEYINTEILNNNLELLSRNLEFDTIRLLGGEPLLHKDINKIVEMTRKYFPTTTIHIVTNGILLMSMGKSFWETVLNNRITIDISIYPINSEICKKAINLIETYGIKYIYRKTKYFYTFFNPDEKNNIKKNFKNCYLRGCTTLRENHIYVCPLASSIRHYNKYFNKNLIEEKGININNKSIKQVLKYLNKPIESCKYCTFWRSENQASRIKWELSKNEINEWKN